MKRVRVSVAWSMVAVALFAFTFAALKDRTGLWSGVLTAFATALMLTAALGTCYSKSPTLRGFVVFGWGYWLVTGPSYRTHTTETLSSVLVTEAIIITNKLTPVRGWDGLKSSDMSRLNQSPFRDQMFEISARFDSVYSVANVIMWLVVGSVGALLAPIMESRCKRAASPEAAP